MSEIKPSELKVGDIISNAFKIGFANLGALIGATLLWIITIWIPYINIGTTIGLYGLIVTLSKGEKPSATDIFKSQYRKYIGEFFILLALSTFGIFFGLYMLIVPAIVIALAWSQSFYLLVDKELNPLECLKVSNQITYGKKWTIFGGMFLLVLILYIPLFIIFWILGKVSAGLAAIILILGYIFIACIIFGADAYIYGELKKRIE
ncbi:MAG: hypothetical protein N2490_06240, partial [Ignavibacteria bacterium]|nr:hypothetical protein [Ignavibacteria bacterium]